MLSKVLIQGLKKLKAIIHYPAFLLSLGLVGWFEALFTIEWSFPYCSSQQDGPASAVFGMPFPYIRYSEVTSMEYFYMPSIFVVNILILFVIAFPFVSWAVKKIASPDQQMRRGVMSFAGLVLFLSIGAVVMYANVHQKTDLTKESLITVIASDIAEYQKRSAELKVVDADPIHTRVDERAKDKKATIKYFTGDRNGNDEAVAYIDEGKVVVMLVLTAKNKKDFESSLLAFKELVGSYFFLGEATIHF